MKKFRSKGPKKNQSKSQNKSQPKGKPSASTKPNKNGSSKNASGRNENKPNFKKNSDSKFEKPSFFKRGDESPKKSNLKFTEGYVKRHPDGFGFLITDDVNSPDVYIPKHSMNGIMTNDRVMVDVQSDPYEPTRFRGEIVRVVKRAFLSVLGKYHDKNDEFGYLPDAGYGWGMDLKIVKSLSISAKNGDMVKVEILSYPGSEKGFTGKVVEVFGSYEDPLLDVKKVIFSQKIPHEFSVGAIQEARALPKTVQEADKAGRRDLTKLPLITIDGKTAKDFDDAVYTEQTPKGFRAIVAIADVSHYVKPGRSIDKDAYERGNSTYFPNYVVPMLPEELSNELCSLKPNVERLALVADMVIDYTGELRESEFYEAVIKSQARVIYGEAQEVIDGNPMPHLEHVKENILKSADLAKLLMANRFKNGSLHLEIGETQLVLDETGQPIDIIRAERVFAHKLIEEMMLIANVAVAKFFDAKKIEAIYRVHDAPFQEAILLLSKYLTAFGGKRSLAGEGLQKRLTKALQEFEGTPQEEVLNILTLRSMNQAQYSANNIGHFGLGFSHYTHFTSPIRRYPDLIVHRLLKAIITTGKGYALMSREDLDTAGTHFSATEQRSTKSERQFNAIKKARFMKTFLGEEFEGLVSSVAKFGVFVLLRQYDVDGLVKLDDMGDRFDFDEENLRLVGRKTKRVYEVGQIVNVKVVNVDIESGRVDFWLADIDPERTAYARSRS